MDQKQLSVLDLDYSDPVLKPYKPKKGIPVLQNYDYDISEEDVAALAKEFLCLKNNEVYLTTYYGIQTTKTYVPAQKRNAERVFECLIRMTQGTWPHTYDSLKNQTLTQYNRDILKDEASSCIMAVLKLKNDWEAVKCELK
jgi:hypothetical protein